MLDTFFYSWRRQYCTFFHFLSVLLSLRNGSSLPRDQTWAPAVKAVSPNHWTIRKFPAPGTCFFNFFFGCSGFDATRGLFSSCGTGASHRGGLSCCRAQALEHANPVLGAHKLSCSTACRIFWDQGSNSCPLHCKGILNHWTTREACARHCYVLYL